MESNKGSEMEGCPGEEGEKARKEIERYGGDCTSLAPPPGSCSRGTTVDSKHTEGPSEPKEKEVRVHYTSLVFDGLTDLPSSFAPRSSCC